MKTKTTAPDAIGRHKARLAELEAETAELAEQEQRVERELAMPRDQKIKAAADRLVKHGGKASAVAEVDLAGMLSRIRQQRRIVAEAMRSIEESIAVESLSGPDGYSSVQLLYDRAVKSLEAFAVAIEAASEAQRVAMAHFDAFMNADNSLASMAGLPGAPRRPYQTWKLYAVNTFGDLVADGFNPSRVDRFMTELQEAGLKTPAHAPFEPAPVRQPKRGLVADLTAANFVDPR
jgi:hypothetical protein